MALLFMPEFIGIALMAALITKDAMYPRLRGVNWGTAPRMEIVWRRDAE